MYKSFLNLIFILISFLDKIIFLITKRSILLYLKDFFEMRAYTELDILNTKTKFFTPNQLTKWRTETILLKEPETIEWIDNFDNSKEILFWDIGSNIGIYSIYNSIKNKNSKTIAFEPSTSNLRILSRNIFINNLQNQISIFPIALTDKSNVFLNMKENNFIEGSAMNSFGEEWDFEGKKFKSNMSYNIFGTSINFLVENKILKIPNYIKIDVDGLEHLILNGGSKFLKNKEIKSLSIELNENFKEQFEHTLKIMKENDFKILKKNHNIKFLDKKKRTDKTFNYIFEKII
mgnify:CR=1 FL=1